MDKIILDTNQRKENSDFVLNLNGVLDIEDINLDINKAIEDLNREIENKNFEKAKKYSDLLFKISEYGNKDVDVARIKYFYNKIIYNYYNLDKQNIKEIISLIKEIDTVISFILSLRYDDLNDYVYDKLEVIKNIKQELDIIQIVKKTYSDSYDKVTIEDIRIINEVIKITKTKEITEIKYKLEEEVQKKINTIKTLSELEAMKIIKEILINEYENDFFKSFEFLNITLGFKYKEFENNDTLLEFTNKAYLVYRFNKRNTKNEKINELITYGMNDFINLPILFREVVIEKVTSFREKYTIVEEFFFILNKEIDCVKNIKNINFLPI